MARRSGPANGVCGSAARAFQRAAARRAASRCERRLGRRASEQARVGCNRELARRCSCLSIARSLNRRQYMCSLPRGTCSRCRCFKLRALMWPTCPLSVHGAGAWRVRMPPRAVADARTLTRDLTQSELWPTLIAQPPKPRSRTEFNSCLEKSGQRSLAEPRGAVTPRQRDAQRRAETRRGSAGPANAAASAPAKS